MKNTRNVLFALLLSSCVAGAASASTAVSAGIHIGPSGRAAVDLGFFYDDLAPYGNWIERPSYGWVWTPRAVATSWRPYEDGRWVWTDDGWTWITDEPYGWATYHYGRWYDDPEIGWSWVPGDTWGPSWVSWQEGGDYVGWAPLPPGVNVSVSIGGGYGGYAYGIAPEEYVFVPERNFLAPRLATYVVGLQDVGAIYGRTRNCTSYRFNGGRVFNQGVPIDHIQRFAGRVPQYQVADLGYGQGKSWRQPRFEGNRVAMFRPQIQKAARIAPPIQRAAARQAVMSAAQFKAAHPNRAAAFRQQMAQRQQLQNGNRQQFQNGNRQQQFQNGNRQGVRGGQPFRTANQPQQLQKANRQQLQAAQRQQRQAQGQRQQFRGADLKRQQMAQRGQRQQQFAQQQRQGQRQQRQQMAQRNQAQAWQKQARGQRQQQQFAQQRQQRQGAQRQQMAQRNQAQAWQKQGRQGQRQAAQRQQWQGQRQQAQAAQRQQWQAQRQQQRQAAQRQQWQGQRQQAQAAQRQQWQAQRQQQRQAAQQQGQGPRNGGGGRGQGRGNPNRQHGPGGR
jgi:hypothetical protein